MEPLMRTVDLKQGESTSVQLTDGQTVHIKLVDVIEERDPIRDAVRKAEALIEVNGHLIKLEAGNYRLPTEVRSVQIDCPITRGYYKNSRFNHWALEKDARLRLWPAGSYWVRPGTFTYPIRQKWFASGTQMANEPVFVDGGEVPWRKDIYYHSGLDFGGVEGEVEIVAATDGLVMADGKDVVSGIEETPASQRYDTVYLRDARGWFYRYSHLKAVDPAVRVGSEVKMGQTLGLLGKEGGSGGWAHLHFDISAMQPSGKWGTEEAYAFVWQAYLEQHRLELLAVARPHRVAWVGEKVVLDARRSWAVKGIAKYQWLCESGESVEGWRMEKRYGRAGTYSEVLKITDRIGRVSYDFAVVQVIERNAGEAVGPTIHAAYQPTQNIRVGEEILFAVRTFRVQPTEGQEEWSFGDGSETVRVQSDGNADELAPEGYAVARHRYSLPGDYIVKVQRSNRRGETAMAHLWVRVE